MSGAQGTRCTVRLGISRECKHRKGGLDLVVDVCALVKERVQEDSIPFSTGLEECGPPPAQAYGWGLGIMDPSKITTLGGHSEP